MKIKRTFILPKLTFTVLIALFLISCEKNENIQTTPEKNNVKMSSVDKVATLSTNKKNGYKWNKNDDVYKNSLLAFASKINSARLPISSAREPLNPDETYQTPSYVEYGFYDDPENLIVEGFYVAAPSPAEEEAYFNNPDILNHIENSKIYLISEGYSDIVDMFNNDTDKTKIIYAANALLDLKTQMDASGTIVVARAFNCFLQAVGYSALAELGANWATASRQVMLRAVGKVASKYVGWVGAAIMVASYADCMWG